MTPRGWLLRGSSPGDYAVATPAPGRVALRSRVDAPRGFGTVMQTFKADALRGKRLRFAATVGARGVRGWCGLWMRVDGARTEVLAFDNMRDRALTGDVAPARVAVVLDVPAAATKIALGLLLEGAGEATMEALAVEEVGGDVAATDADAALPAGPVNLDLAE